VLAACLAATLAGCHSTVDSLGYDDSTGLHLRKMQGPLSYPNAFRDVLGKTNAQIAEKIANAFNQLFHGDPSTQAIYFPVAGQDQAYIKDILHGDIRTDGMGLGMLIAAELGKQDEFDRLWSYARANMQVQSGPDKGYFLSSCATSINPGVTCFAPFGPQQMVMALLLANDLWGDPTSAAGVTPRSRSPSTATFRMPEMPLPAASRCARLNLAASLYVIRLRSYWLSDSGEMVSPTLAPSANGGWMNRRL